MAKGRHLTPYQKGVVKRYYENRESIAAQKLGEIVSELYLCRNQKKADRLEGRADGARECRGQPRRDREAVRGQEPRAPGEARGRALLRAGSSGSFVIAPGLHTMQECLSAPPRARKTNVPCRLSPARA